MRNQLPIVYEYASFSLTNGQSDYDVKSNQSSLWSNFTTAKSMILKTNKNISMKINSALLDIFPVKIGDTPWQFQPGYLLIQNLYLSNSSGDTATIEIWLFG